MAIHTIYLNNAANSDSFHRKLKSIQCNAALATGAIRGTSKGKLYEELGFESLQLRCWYRKLCYFCKISEEKTPNYFLRLTPKESTRYAVTKDIPQCRTNYEYSKKRFLPTTMKEWNVLDSDI